MNGIPTRFARACWLVLVTTVGMVAFPAAGRGQDLPAGTVGDVTFAKDIAPILQRSCQNCHRPGGVAPMSLVTYEEVRPWARSIKLRTSIRSKMGAMPPWYIEKQIGIQGFKDDPSLSDLEIAKIAKWADSGAPRGNTVDMPPPIEFEKLGPWRIGTPDLVIKTPSVSVKAMAPDWWGPMGETPTGLTEDRYVAAVEYKEISDSQPQGAAAATRSTVGGLFIIHHAAVQVLNAEGNESREGWPTHELGRNAEFFDPAAGRLLKAGSRFLITTVHVHANGTPSSAHLEAAFKFHPRGYVPTKKIQKFNIGTYEVDLRGSESNQSIQGYYTLPQNTKVLTFEPHMHAAGVRMCVEAIWNGVTETLNCAGYDHNWVRVYTYDDTSAPLLPKGTLLHVTGYFDNSLSNRNVPDPRNYSGMGQRSIDQMMFDIAFGLYLTDEEFKQAVEQRQREVVARSGRSSGPIAGCPTCWLPEATGAETQRLAAED